MLRESAGDRQIRLTRRPATAADSELVRGIRDEAMRPYVEATWGWDPDVQEAIHLQWFRPPEVEILLVEEVPVGFLHILRPGDEIRLLRLMLLRDWQSRGIGTSILSDLKREATERGIPIRLQVLRVNERARGLYLRHGFRVEGATETHYQMVFDDLPRRQMRESPVR